MTQEEAAPSLVLCFDTVLMTVHLSACLSVRAGSYFALSLFDKLWHPEVTQEEALDMMEKAVAEAKQRLAVAPPKFLVKVIDKDGTRIVKSF